MKKKEKHNGKNKQEVKEGSEKRRKSSDHDDDGSPIEKSPKKQRNDKTGPTRADQHAKKKDNKKSGEGDGEVWSKSKKKRMRALRAKMKKKESSIDVRATTNSSSIPNNNNSNKYSENKAITKNESNNHGENTTSQKKKGGTSSSLQEKYAARLAGSRFRILNEELYTTTSKTSFERFQTDPELFEQYHEGFRHQVEQWPSNPVDVIFKWISKKYSNAKETIAVADFGCGHAELAKRLLEVKSSHKEANKKKINKQSKPDDSFSSSSSCPFKVHSFDLIAQSELVTACDMANVPLKDKTIDVAIFCLALMGTNVTDFLAEAHRVLKDDGRIKIAEVRSRFETASGKDDLDNFVNQLELLGFDCHKVDRSNKMFVLMELEKNGREPDKRIEVKIKPCIYKRR